MSQAKKNPPGGELFSALEEPQDSSTARVPQRGNPSAIATPMMAQYLKIKQTHPSALLFYRMGDFYELFFDDAKKASAILDITLTKRGKHLGEDIPMCGVPFHAADNYIHRLIRAGEHIAVAEQVEPASKHGKLMERRIVRIITQGTLTEEALLDKQQYNYLLSVNDSALAWADISTGLFRIKVSKGTVFNEIARLNPKEILVAEDAYDKLTADLRAQLEQYHITKLPKTAFKFANAKNRIIENFGEASAVQLEGLSKEALGAAGALLDYIELTQMENSGKLQAPLIENDKEFMMIDSATRANLELVKPLRQGQKKTTLFSVLSKTQTSAGARLLAERLESPLMSIEAINHRLDEIAFFKNNFEVAQETQTLLEQAPDSSRALGRISFGRARPNDLAVLRDSLKAARAIAGILKMQKDLPLNIKNAIENLKAPPAHLCSSLEQALADSMPATFREGGVVRANYDSSLDQQREHAQENRRKMKSLQEDYVRQTKIKALKIKYNNVLGFFVEIPASQSALLLKEPLNKTFIHRQTLANNLRFSTQELAVLASAELESKASALAREKTIIDLLIEGALQNYSAIHQAASAIASLDLAITLARLATELNLIRPEIDEASVFDVVAARHLVVEQALANEQKPFIHNDCALHEKEKSIWLLTGPNMAGKSTFLRQNAIIAVLAQAGMFVPASHARIGLIDKLFSRIGAADNLAFGQSTFMVEMVEAATILTQATSRSFVIIDEIGRGTATFDGLALAWAIVEFMCEKLSCRCLFATHFHELTTLADKLPQLANYHMKTAHSEQEQNMHLLYEVGEGCAHHSYGIQIAKLAGLPQSVITRADDLLEGFESQKISGVAPSKKLKQKPKQLSAAEKMLQEVDPETLSPREALEILFQMKKGS